MAGHGIIGTWEIIGFGRHISGNHFANHHDLEGIKFRLDDNGDIIWNVPDHLKSVPLFECETFELCDVQLSSGVVIRLGAYGGHVLEFKTDQIDPLDTLTLTCEGDCVIQCKRVDVDIQESNHFSLLPALEDGYFSDFTITSSNNKQFKVHLFILQLQCSDIDWTSDPSPFHNLPEDVLGTILHFLYTECLPENLNEFTAHQVISAASPYDSLTKLVNLCKVYLKNTALKQQIIGLVVDMHTSMSHVIDCFSRRDNLMHSEPIENIYNDPAKLCFLVKQSLREAAVAGVKFLFLCDLFTKRKGELSRSERHEIIRYAKSRLPVFLTQLQSFLQGLRDTFCSMNCVQRLDIATFLVPEVEVILDTISILIVEFEKALFQIIQSLTPDGQRSKSSVGDFLGRSLRSVLHIKELTKLRVFQQHINCTLGILLHKKESFNEMSPSQKVRSIAQSLDKLIEELPVFLIRLEGDRSAFDEKLEWREFKFCFKVGTSKVSGILQKLVAHRETLQDVINQVCGMVQSDAFRDSLQALGLLDPCGSTSSNESQQSPKRSSYSTPKHHQGYTLNLVESLCIPPVASKSILSKLSLQLLQNETNTDMEFEIVKGSSESTDNSEETNSTDGSCIIKAHRVIVAARCDWFRRALLSGMREAIDKKIIIHDTNAFLFRIFLEYLYSGRLKQESLSTEQLVELLLLSDRYEVDSLKQTCEYALRSSIEIDSVLYFLSLADQYSARILKNACLHFISRHQELTESEVFFELPISLQAEIFDCVWTQPTPRKSVTMEQLLPTSSESPSSPGESFPPSSNYSELHHAVNRLVLDVESHNSNSSSTEEPLISQNPGGRLDTYITQLRDIVGESAPREQLIQVILAADYDLCRAVNFYYARTNGDQ